MILLSALLFFGTDLHAASDQEVMDAACDVLPISCEGIEPPTIVVTAFLTQMGLHGLYVHGEDQIFVSTQAPPETILHETVHYVLYEAGLRFSRCDGEMVARQATAKWLKEDYDDSWRRRYGCTTAKAQYSLGHPGVHIIRNTD